jgi:hypothetical protein
MYVRGDRAGLKWLSNASWLTVLIVLGCGGPGSPDNARTVSDGAALPLAPTVACQRQYDHYETECPGAGARYVAQCLYDFGWFEGIGCDGDYGEWVACTTGASVDCTNGSVSECLPLQTAYMTCLSEAVDRTHCVRAPTDDVRCETALPYAFSACVAGTPSGCVQLVDAGAGLWCCPQL